jgi:hypothetical protein
MDDRTKLGGASGDPENGGRAPAAPALKTWVTPKVITSTLSHTEHGSISETDGGGASAKIS